MRKKVWAVLMMLMMMGLAEPAWAASVDGQFIEVTQQIDEIISRNPTITIVDGTIVSREPFLVEQLDEYRVLNGIMDVHPYSQIQVPNPDWINGDQYCGAHPLIEQDDSAKTEILYIDTSAPSKEDVALYGAYNEDCVAYMKLQQQRSALIRERRNFGDLLEDEKVQIDYGNGEYYIGEVNEAGLPHGLGQYIKTQDRITGPFTYAYYEGAFTNGQMTGEGRQYSQKEDQYIAGLYRNGALVVAENDLIHSSKYSQTPLVMALAIDVPCILCEDGSKRLIDVAPKILDGGTAYVPLRATIELLDGQAEWNAATRTVDISQKGNHVTLVADDRAATVNGVNKQMSQPARIVEGRVMIPVRFVSEALGYIVRWEPEEQLITITETDGQMQSQREAIEIKAVGQRATHQDAAEQIIMLDGAIKAEVAYGRSSATWNKTNETVSISDVQIQAGSDAEFAEKVAQAVEAAGYAVTEHTQMNISIADSLSRQVHIGDIAKAYRQDTQQGQLDFTVDNADTVFVNGASVASADGEHYSYAYSLQEGENAFAVEASNTYGFKDSCTVTLYYQPALPEEPTRDASIPSWGTGPELQVFNIAAVHEGMTTLSGMVNMHYSGDGEPVLTINGKIGEISFGYFNESVELTNGRNNILVEAADNGGTTSFEMLVDYDEETDTFTQLNSNM